MPQGAQKSYRPVLGWSSLRARLLIAASIILTASFVLIGAALESAFRRSAVQAERDRLETLVHTLLGATHYAASGALGIEDAKINDPRLRQPISGISGTLLDEWGRPVWSSADAMPVPAEFPAAGEWVFEQRQQPALFIIAYGFEFIDAQAQSLRYTAVVADSSSAYLRQLAAFRRSLFVWLLGSGLLLAASQGMALRWGVAPLRRLVNQLRRVELGEQSEIQGHYPDELEPLADGLNAMIRNERNQQSRYRRALSDLSHSLKTPMAVVRSYADDSALPSAARQALAEQVALMQQITGYQISKAAAAGRRTLSEPVALRPIVEKLAGALSKVYAGKALDFDIGVAESLRLRADVGDLYELLGGLMDNAAKYGKGRIRVSAQRLRARGTIYVEDDGPGFRDDTEHWLLRGLRADSQTPGQGIGLAAVLEVVQAYEGRVQLERSDLGGARVTVQMPA